MNCPACETKGMALVPEANLYRCPNCNWTVAQTAPKKKRAAKKRAKKKK